MQGKLKKKNATSHALYLFYLGVLRTDTHRYSAQSYIRQVVVHWCQVRHSLGFALCVGGHIDSSLGQSRVAQCRPASSCKNTVAKVLNLSGVSDASAACSICPTLPYQISTYTISNQLSAVFTPLFAGARQDCIATAPCMLTAKYMRLDCFLTSHR